MAKHWTYASRDSFHPSPPSRPLPSSRRAASNAPARSSRRLPSSSLDRPASADQGPKLVDPSIRQERVAQRHEQATPTSSIEPLGRAAKGETGVPSVVDRVLDQGGTPLAGPARQRLESKLGYDFGNLRVHADNDAARAADALRSRAFTSGHHIVFGGGQYRPQSPSGFGLLAHEATHTVQQAGTAGVIQRQAMPEGAAPALSPLEQKALRAAEKARQDPTKTSLTIQGAAVVYRLIADHLPHFGALISGVGFSAGTSGVVARVHGQAVDITIGRDFVFGTVASELPARIGELRSALQGQASHLLQQQPDACLGAAVKQPTQSPPPPAATTTPETPELSEARRTILEEWQKVRGAAYQGSEEEKKKWQKILPGVDVAAQRRADSNYTTCGALPQYLFRQLGGINDPGITSGGLIGVRDGIQLGDQKSPDESWVKGRFGPWAWTDKSGQIFRGGAKKLGAWIEHDGKKRPRPGDIYILEGVINATEVAEGAKPQIGIRHIGVLLGITPRADGMETWTTGDAGQGVGNDQKAVQQDRTYDPQERTVTGARDKGTVIGWVDLDLLVSASAKKEAEIASQAKKP